MNVGVEVLRSVKLYNPVDCRKVDAPGGDVCGEEDCRLLLDELEVHGCPLVLSLFSVQLEQILPEL